MFNYQINLCNIIAYCFQRVIIIFFILSSHNIIAAKKASFDFSIPIVKAGELVARGYDSHIDLRWKRELGKRDKNYGYNIFYNIYRSEKSDGPFEKINKYSHKFHVYTDFVGPKNKQIYFYKIARIDGSKEKDITNVAFAKTHPMNNKELLTAVQLATFRYFWDGAHPISGMATCDNRRTRINPIGANGFGMYAYPIGIERGFITRKAGAKRMLKILRFLQEKLTFYHGAMAHWVYAKDGSTKKFSKLDDGADLIETAFMMEGLLGVRNYFANNNPTENEIRKRINELWAAVEWNWFLDKKKGQLHWHWSPKNNWVKGLMIRGYHEGLIAYVLAVASMKYSIAAKNYHKGWAGSKHYVHNKVYYGYKQYVGHQPKGGSLFTTQYSFIAINPHMWRDRYCDYFDNSKNVSLINRAYCIENPKNHKGYGPNAWGLTAGSTPFGYNAMSPTFKNQEIQISDKKDNGTIVISGALSAMPFTPKESMDALKHFYYKHGKGLFKEFGFRDSYNENKNWYSPIYLALNQAPILCMIENARTGLCWKLFMRNTEIIIALKKIGSMKK